MKKHDRENSILKKELKYHSIQQMQNYNKTSLSLEIRGQLSFSELYTWLIGK